MADGCGSVFTWAHVCCELYTLIEWRAGSLCSAALHPCWSVCPVFKLMMLRLISFHVTPTAASADAVARIHGDSTTNQPDASSFSSIEGQNPGQQ